MAIFYTDSGSFNDISVTGSSVFSGSVIISGSAQSIGGGFTGSFTGSLTGTFPYSGLTNVPSGIVSSSNQVATLLPAGTYSSSTQLPSGIISSSAQVITNLPNGTVSSSGQVSYTGLSNIPNAIVSSSTQFTNLSAPFTGSFTGSHTGTFPYNGLTGTPSGIVSSSAQVTSLLPTGTYSSSAQLPSGIVSSSTQVIANLPTGTVSSSGQVSYTGLSNIPNAIVSSSTQFTSLTAPFTGSFTGSHIGTLTGTASWASNVISSSFSTTASAATSITFTPTSASFATTSSFAVSASWAPGGTGTVGPGTVNSIALFNATSTISSSNIFQSTNNIGVGVVSPSNTLQVAGNISASSYTSSIVNGIGFVGTSSFAVSASWAPGGSGPSSAFPFNGDAVITGSLFVSGSSTRSGITGSNILALSRFLATPTAVSPGSPIYTFTGIDGNNVSGSEFGMWLSTGSTNSALAIGYRGLDTAKPAYLNMFYNDLAALGRITIEADEIYPATDNATSLGALNQNFSQAYITEVGTGKIDATLAGGSNLIITGSVTITALAAQDIIRGVSGIDGYTEIVAENTSAGTNASTDIVAAQNSSTEVGGFIDMGINSTTYNVANNIGGPNDGYLYMTSSNGEMYVGNASTGANSNIKLFAGGLDGDVNTHMFISSSGRIGINVTASLGADLQVNGSISASSYTGSVFGGPLLNISEMSMLVSGTIRAPGGSTVTLNINDANYFAVSASGTGTVTWVATNPPPSGRTQTIIVEYTNGGVVTNSWFTGTRWPGGAAPTLTSGANPDVLGFITDDAGTTWRGVLLQRNSS